MIVEQANIPFVAENAIQRLSDKYRDLNDKVAELFQKNVPEATKTGNETIKELQDLRKQITIKTEKTNRTHPQDWKFWACSILAIILVVALIVGLPYAAFMLQPLLLAFSENVVGLALMAGCLHYMHHINEGRQELEAMEKVETSGVGIVSYLARARLEQQIKQAQYSRDNTQLEAKDIPEQLKNPHENIFIAWNLMNTIKAGDRSSIQDLVNELLDVYAKNLKNNDINIPNLAKIKLENPEKAQ